ncbi:Metalloenzyme, LuxS/M16 peptidase-like protein [Obelidium mucronatum]|nr:Metalloenzyme, LuxS/M16 peptidase-like protein [Obelidium mucronatum]
MTTAAAIFEAIRTPDIDNRLYHPETDRASAALDVNVGFLTNAPGLAHFLEHLLFLGTEKYPRENEYSQYLSDVGGGYSNAYTGAENTNYYFEVSAAFLEGSLDRFAQFFTSPLFDASCTERELNAVDSEHKKNLQEDDWRLQQLEQDLSRDQHPYKKFGTGNLETLKVVPESRGIKTRELCIEFYKQHYSANIMKLAVLGKESLDQLQTWVEEKFSSIANRNVTPAEYLENPMGPNQLKTLIRVRPVKDTQMLTLLFPWPDTTRLYKKSPHKYISHLIGHESEGSILSLLKHEGLASDFSCWPSHGANGFAFFKIQIYLSDKGLERWEDIVVIVFQYIKMLQSTQVLEWVYEENAIMSRLAFKYQEKISASSYCSGLAQSMHDYDKSDILCGPYMMEDFDPTLIKSMIDLLQPECLRIMLVASSAVAPEECQLAPWYGTEFKVESFSESLIESLKSAPLNSSLSIPRVNPFIPHNFPIIPADQTVDAFEHPRIIKDTPTTRLWFLLDTKYKVPRTSVTMMIKSPVAYASPRFAVLTHLYCDLVTDALNQSSYLAEMADLCFALDVTVEGIILSVGGYSDKLPMFLETVVQAMTRLEVIPERFTFVKEELARCYSNFEIENPDHHASYFLTWLLQEKLWTDAEKLQEIAFITPQDIVNFYPSLMNPVHIEAFHPWDFGEIGLFGSFSEPMYSLKTHLSHIAVSFQTTKMSTMLWKSTCNSAVPLEILVARALLLDQIISEPCFDTLRTKEQLGYVAWKRDPLYVESRIHAFWNSVRDIIVGLSEEEFKRHCTTLSSKILQKHKYMMASTEYYWDKISNGSYDFTRREQNAQKVSEISKDELLSFHDTFIRKDGDYRKLSVQIWSSQGIKAAGGAVTEDLKDGDIDMVECDAKVAKDEGSSMDIVLTDDVSVADMRNRWALSRGGYPVASINTFYSF